jgi:hypothetical protein
MPRSLVERSVDDFIARHPDAEAQRLPDGSYSIRLTDVPLIGWSKMGCAIAWVVPAAFPLQRPDCFWTDGDLLLASGACPANSQVGPQHPLHPGMRWFSYHPNAWDIRDTVETYWHLIQGRLLQAR